MHGKQQEKGRINRILSQCNKCEIFHEDMHYFMEKTQQLKQFQRYFNTTMNNIIKAEQSQSQDQKYQSNAQMAQTIYARLQKHKMTSTKTLLLDYENKKRTRFRSLPTTSMKSKKYSQDSIKQWISKSNINLNLPSLILKVKKNKQPSNASKNRTLQYDSKDQNKEEVDVTYEQIKIERRKVQEKRHLFIMGKVMDQNHRKEIRNLWNLKRTNRAIKLKKNI